MVTPEQLGTTIIRLRRLKGLSQEALAHEANIDRRYMSDLENGKRNLSLDVLNRLASVFGISMTCLIQEAEDTERVFDSIASLKNHLTENGYDRAIVLEDPNYITAVMGVNDSGRLIYSYNRMIHFLMLTEGLSKEEAINYMDFNTIRAIPYMGDFAPIILFDL